MWAFTKKEHDEIYKPFCQAHIPHILFLQTSKDSKNLLNTCNYNRHAFEYECENKKEKRVKTEYENTLDVKLGANESMRKKI